jgi:capsular polysaccharide biosynthesis protein
MRFAEQVRVFDVARLVVGEYGSGLLNALFCRPGAAVLALNRVDGYLARIARSLDLDLGYLAPEGGAFVTDAELMRKPRKLAFAPEALRDAIGRVRVERALAGRA